MGDGASDMAKEYEMERSAIRWLERQIPLVLKDKRLGLTKFTIVVMIQQMEHERIPSVWS